MAGATVQIQMPEMGESVTEGTILEWHKREGDYVEEGETVVEVSTDKVDAEVPAPASGTITQLLGAEDDTVDVGAVLAELETGAAPSGNGASDRQAPKDAVGSGAMQTATDKTADRTSSDTGDERATSETPEAQSTGGTGPSEAAPGPNGARSSPLARRAAAAHGVDLGRVRGSGAGGKITKADVLAAPQDAGGDSKEQGAGEATVLRGPAAMLVRAMDESLATPTATSFRTLAVDVLDAKRKALNGVLAERGMKVSFTHLTAWAIAVAAREWPVMARAFEQSDG